MNISKLKNKNIYESLTFSHTIPTSENKWVEYYPFLEKSTVKKHAFAVVFIDFFFHICAIVIWSQKLV